MKSATTMAVGIVLVLAGAASADDRKPLDALQGTWTSVSYEIGGTRIEGADLKAVIASITIKGDVFEWRAGDSNDKGTIKIDATKDPKQIDFVSEPEEGVKVTTWTGIYTVEGDTFKFCVGPGTGQRPKDFSTKSATHGVFTLKQSK